VRALVTALPEVCLLSAQGLSARACVCVCVCVCVWCGPMKLQAAGSRWRGGALFVEKGTGVRLCWDSSPRRSEPPPRCASRHSRNHAP
jgi:hypothetical protein